VTSVDVVTRLGSGSTPAWVDDDLWFDVLLAATVASLVDDLDVVVHSATRHGGSRVVVTLGGCPLASTLSLSCLSGTGGGRRIRPSLLLL
jgi:hypothetical protein